MEIVGLAISGAVALCFSLALALTALAFRSLRRFLMMLLITPPTAVLLYYFTAWTLIDNSPLCGPNLEWDHCPSIGARVLAFISLSLAVAVVAFAGFWAQRLFLTRAGLFPDPPATTLFASRFQRSEAAKDAGLKP